MRVTVLIGGEAVTFEGFCAITLPACKPRRLVVAFVDGDTDFWYIANTERALEELRTYYRTTGCIEITLQVWSDCEVPISRTD